jgi:hypothetical protein
LHEEISAGGLGWIDPDGAEEKLAEFDATYEPFLQALAQFLIIELPSVSPRGENGNGLDNWQRSVRGRSAKGLVEQARSGTDSSREINPPKDRQVDRSESA